MCTVDEKKQDGLTRLLPWNGRRIFVSTNATEKNTTWKPVSNDQYNFLNTLCILWIFIHILFPYYDKSRILVHTALNLKNTEKKSLYLNAYDKKCVFYSFENLYWVAPFFREWEEDGEDDVILNISEKMKNDQSIRCKEKSRSSC